jgi:hypothetical protein
MTVLDEEQSADFILSTIAVTREDITRAKEWVMPQKESHVRTLVDKWLDEQGLPLPKFVNAEDPKSKQSLGNVSKSYSLRLAFYQALWELISVGDLFPSGPAIEWSAQSIDYHTSRSRSGVDLRKLTSSHPERIERPYLAPLYLRTWIFFLGGLMYLRSIQAFTKPLSSRSYASAAVYISRQP